VANAYENDAFPFARVELPSTLEPFKNETDPVNFPAYSPVTVAVNTTFWLKDEGLGVALRVVVVVASVTVCVRAPELDPNVPSPPYEAAIESDPAARLDGVSAATPFTRPTEPITALPFLNVTVPVGVPEPEPGATFAVNVTAWP